MAGPGDPYDLERFLTAQAPVYDRALVELRQGRKTSHWMWFVFPQLAGLGSSPMAQRYAIGSLGEARAYLDHPALGERLRACAQTAAAGGSGRTAEEVFGPVDALKFCSSMTLFEAADPADPVFAAALDAVCAGRRDPATLRRLQAS